MKTKKMVALQIIVVMLINLFMPYTVLLTESKAAVTVPKPASAFTVITEELDSEGVIEIAIGLTGNYLAYGTTFFLQFDNTKLTPAIYSRKTGYIEAEDMADWDPISSAWASNYSQNNSWWFQDKGQIRIQTAAGNYNPSIDGYSAMKGYDFSEVENKYNGFYPVVTMAFLVSDGFTTDDITTDLIKLVPDPYDDSYYTGLDIIYEDDGNQHITDVSYVAYNGFIENNTKKVTGISVTRNPTDVDYEHGDEIKPDRGKITVTYDDNSTEKIDMKSSGVNILPKNADIKSCDSEGKQEITVTYEGQTTTYKVSVTDPITSVIATNTNPTKSYDHDQAFTLSDIDIKVTKKSGATINNLKGNSTGHHLHFEIRTSSCLNGNAIRVNPRDYIEF